MAKEINTEAIIKLIIVFAILILAYKIYNGIFGKDDDESKIEELDSKVSDILDFPTYMKALGKKYSAAKIGAAVVVGGSAKVRAAAKILDDCLDEKYVTDEQESKAIAALNSMSNRAQISFLSKFYSDEYERSLQQDLGALDDAPLAKAYKTIIAKKDI